MVSQKYLQSMNSSQPQRMNASPWLGGFFLVVGLLALGLLELHSRRGMIATGDPGPWLLPRLLGGVLIAGGLYLLVARFLASRRGLSEVGDDESVEHRPMWQPLALIAGIVLYLLVLPWAGFAVSTPVFVFLVLMGNKLPWWRAVLVGVLVMAVVVGLFQWVLKVPLPVWYWG